MRRPVVFIGMETSGRFQALGFRVYSCDLLPAEDRETRFHLVGDVFEKLDWLRENGLWPDFAIFHPDCTNVTNAAEPTFPRRGSVERADPNL